MKIGDLVEFKNLGTDNIFAVVLKTFPSNQGCLIALASSFNSGSSTRIGLAESMWVYPSIQATVWSKELRKIRRTDIDSLGMELSKQIYKWPALTRDEKISIAETNISDNFILGNPKGNIENEFAQSVQLLRAKALDYYKNLDLPAQLSRDLLISKIQNLGNAFSLEDFEKANLGLYSSKIIAETLRRASTESEKSKLYRNILTRRAGQIKSSGTFVGFGREENDTDYVFNFLNSFGYKFVTLLVSQETMQKSKRSIGLNGLAIHLKAAN